MDMISSLFSGLIKTGLFLTFGLPVLFLVIGLFIGLMSEGSPFSFYGRLNRKKFILRSLLSIILFIFTITSAYYLIDNTNSTILRIIAILFVLLSFLYCWATYAKRLHDLNYSGWWVIALFSINAFLPEEGFLSLIIGLLPLGILSFISGTKGRNKYGPDPLQSQPMTPWYSDKIWEVDEPFQATWEKEHSSKFESPSLPDSTNTVLLDPPSKPFLTSDDFEYDNNTEKITPNNRKSEKIKEEPLEFQGVKVFRSAFNHENDHEFEKLISILPPKIQVEFREAIAHYRHYISRSLIVNSKLSDLESVDFFGYYQGFWKKFVPYVISNFEDSDLFLKKDALQLDEYENQYYEALNDSHGNFTKEALEEFVDSFFSVNDFSIHNTFNTYGDELDFENEIKLHLLREYLSLNKTFERGL